MLTKQDIFRLVNQYIGVSGGYLGDFSYRTHNEFYLQHCDLDIDTYSMEGTTRERFIKIISESSPDIQAKIIRGVLEKYPVGFFSEEKRAEKTKLSEYFLNLANELENSIIESPVLKVTSDVVARAINDARQLIKENGATSGVDRVHTALHGYLKAICEENNILHPEDPTINQLYKAIRDNHPSLKSSNPHEQENVDKILRSLSGALDALNPLRNKSSLAHPNKNLLNEEEATFVINTAYTILHYLNSKFSKKENPEVLKIDGLLIKEEDLPF